MTRAIAKLTFAIALVVAVLSCKGANAPLVDAPVVVTLSEAGASDEPEVAADPIVDAGPPVAIIEIEDAAAFGPVGDQAHHEKITLAVKGFELSPKPEGETVTVKVTRPGESHVALLTVPARSYFLDNSFVDYGMSRGGCIVQCVPVRSQIDLVEYVDEGQRWSPPSQQRYVQQARVSSYRTTDLRGVIDIEIDYFADKKCRVPKVFKKRITR